LDGEETKEVAEVNKELVAFEDIPFMKQVLRFANI